MKKNYPINVGLRTSLSSSECAHASGYSALLGLYGTKKGKDPSQ